MISVEMALCVTAATNIITASLQGYIRTTYTVELKWHNISAL